jgi:hypothetical protein
LDQRTLSADRATPETVAAAPIPDIVDHAGETDNSVSADVSLWDFAAIAAPTPVPQFNDSEVLVSPIVAC